MPKIKKPTSFNRLVGNVKIWGAKPVLGSLYQD
jgi:hypothetical protein